MRKHTLGPSAYSDWVEALSAPLTYENVAYLKCGKLKEKRLTKALFNRISDRVVDTYNRNAEAVKAADYPEIIFSLRRFTAELSLLLFFQELDFLAEADRRALTQSLADATLQLIKAIWEKFNTQNADLIYELNALRRKIGAGIHE